MVKAPEILESMISPSNGARHMELFWWICERIAQLICFPRADSERPFPLAQCIEAYDLSNWRIAASGGAPIARITIEQMKEHFPNVPMFNTYDSGGQRGWYPG